jgi:hypothetical protein
MKELPIYITIWIFFLFITTILTHIIAGVFAFISATWSIFVSKTDIYYYRFNNIFFYSMTIVFLTAIPLALIGQKPLLFFIQSFDEGLAFLVYRYVKNRIFLDKKSGLIVAFFMIVISIIAIIVGAHFIYLILSESCC